MVFYPVCKISEISAKKPKLYTIDGVKILIVKDNADKFWVFEATCTHEEKSLENAKWDAEKACLTCPFHGAVFAISQAGLAISPPAVLPLKVYKIKVENNNFEPFLFVDLDS